MESFTVLRYILIFNQKKVYAPIYIKFFSIDSLIEANGNQYWLS